MRLMVVKVIFNLSYPGARFFSILALSNRSCYHGTKSIFDCVRYVKLYQYIILRDSSRHFKQYTGTGRVDDGVIRGDRK